ncbi:hypothetical protein D3C81_939820 [compost metagenome]
MAPIKTRMTVGAMTTSTIDIKGFNLVMNRLEDLRIGKIFGLTRFIRNVMSYLEIINTWTGMEMAKLTVRTNILLHSTRLRGLTIA